MLQPSEALYKKAHKALEGYDFNGAIKSYEQLTARFPFTDEARQARLDLIYAYYRAGEGESATDAAETFIRENPTHPRVDYAYYVKGLVDFERSPNAIERLFHADLTKRPPSTARKAFAAFKTVVEQYPKSEYAHDSLQRMVYLRNRLASYEVHVARYYYKRGAYVAAAQRARGAIEQYDGSPAVHEALDMLIQCSDHLPLQAPDHAGREARADQPAQPGVVIPVHADQHGSRHERLVAELGAVEGAEPLRVTAGDPEVLVPGQHPEPRVVGSLGLIGDGLPEHRLLPAQLREHVVGKPVPVQGAVGEVELRQEAVG